jgi:hypothetical protein
MDAPEIFFIGFTVLLVLGIIPKTNYVHKFPKIKQLVNRAGFFAGLLMLALFIVSLIYIVTVGFPE